MCRIQPVLELAFSDPPGNVIVGEIRYVPDLPLHYRLEIRGRIQQLPVEEREKERRLLMQVTYGPCE